MKINRMSEEQIAPAWVFEDGNVSKIPSYISEQEFQRLASASDRLSDDGIVSERDYIEECAKNGSNYCLSSKWDKTVKSSLREYAIVCGMDMSKFKEINPDQIERKEVVASNDKVIKMAQNMISKEKTLVLNDPFKLDVEAKNIKDDSWQSIKGQAKLDDKPSIMSGSIKPIRGGEDYFANSDIKTARGQNSISEPNAISKLADDTVEDTGARLRRENQEKEAQKGIKHKEWETEKIEAMAGKEILPNRYIFPTEVLSAQSGLGSPSSKMGVYAKFDTNDIPDKTDGENIKEANEQRKKSIQRETVKEDWQVRKSSSVARVSDTLADELKKYMNEVD